MSYITEYNHFIGDSEALIDAANEIFHTSSIVNDNKIVQTAMPDEERGGGRHGNVRLLRHYVSVGAVDKPGRRGRVSVYRGRQLMQYCVARNLVLHGFPLREVADYTNRLTTTGLSEIVARAGDGPVDRMAMRVLLDRSIEQHGNFRQFRDYEPGSPTGGSAETVQMVRDARMQIENELATLLEDRRHIEELSRRLKAELTDCLDMQEEIRHRYKEMQQWQRVAMERADESMERHRDAFSEYARRVEEKMSRLEERLAVSLSDKGLSGKKAE